MPTKIKQLLNTMAAQKASNEAMALRIAELEAGDGAQDTATKGTKSRRPPSVPGVDGQKFSFAKAVHAINSGDWGRAGYEQEVFAAATKALNLADDASAGFIVPSEVMAEIIPLLRSAMIVDTLGINRMDDMKASPVEIDKQRGGGTGFWVGEEETITESEQSLGLVRLRPHKAGALTKISNTILRAGGNRAESFVRDDLSKVLARTIQAAFFSGTGFGSQPLGVENHPSVNSVTFGGVPTVELLQRMIEEIDVDDAMIGTLKWVMHPRMRNKISKLAYGGAGGPILTGPRGGDISQDNAKTLLGHPYMSTTDIALGATTSTIFLAVWAEAILADWGALELRATDSAGDAFTKDQTWVRAIQEVDVGLRHEESVCVSTGAVWTP